MHLRWSSTHREVRYRPPARGAGAASITRRAPRGTAGASGLGHARAAALPGCAGSAPRGALERRPRPAAWPARRQAGQYGRVTRLRRPGPRYSGVQPLRHRAQAHRADARSVRCAAGGPAGPRLPHLYLRDEPALCARGSRPHRQERVGAGPAQSGGARGGGPDAAHGVGELRRCRPSADAPRPHPRGAGALVRQHAAAERRLPGGVAPRLAAAECTRLRLAARRAHLGEPESERAEPVDGTLLRGLGAARGHDALGGSRHHPSAGDLRRTRPRRAGAPEEDAGPRA